MRGSSLTYWVQQGWGPMLRPGGGGRGAARHWMVVEAICIKWWCLPSRQSLEITAQWCRHYLVSVVFTEFQLVFRSLLVGWQAEVLVLGLNGCELRVQWVLRYRCRVVGWGNWAEKEVKSATLAIFTTVIQSQAPGCSQTLYSVKVVCYL